MDVDNNKNREFIEHVKVSDIPWRRLATAYGRATDFPQYFDALLSADESEVSEAGRQIAMNIEHQETLWPATPFALIFLMRIYKESLLSINEAASCCLAGNLHGLFKEIAKICHTYSEMKHAQPFAFFEDMLDEKYLWPEEYDEDVDEMRYEEDGGPIPDDLFYSFYYWSNEALELR